jgi:LysR family glycine cleavage system transcriptional activator
MQTLRAFEAAARHENYSAAAQELGVTHGAISHRIRELETELGVTLFRRAGRAMTPTREAVTLLAQVREALELLQRVLLTDKGDKRGRLVIGVHPSLATRWLVPRLPRFAERFPTATIEVRSTADLGDFLAQGVDVAIRYGAGEWPNAARERIAGEVLFPVCTPAYRDAHALRVPADLAHARLLRHAWQPWSPWLQAARIKVREPSAGLVVSDSGMLLEAAAAGEGVALARGLFAVNDLASGRLVRLFDLTVADTYSYYLLWHSATPLSRIGEAFRDWLHAEIASAELPVARPPAVHGRATSRR